jgi:alkanesulfonate monooxygenase SsuD/methylene tetrahydromethanopterin reductase-like flavin-dependent oxidoreductase (luciferase family)
MLLVAFMQASNCSNYPASWRHAATEMRFLTPDYSQHIARTLEAGKFHLAFVDDRLAMPSQYGESFAEALQHGIRVVKLDLVPVVTAMALATRYLGVGATYSTTYQLSGPLVAGAGTPHRATLPTRLSGAHSGRPEQSGT